MCQLVTYIYLDLQVGVPIKPYGMVNRYPLATIWHPFEGAGIAKFYKIHSYFTSQKFNLYVCVCVCQCDTNLKFPLKIY